MTTVGGRPEGSPPSRAKLSGVAAAYVYLLRCADDSLYCGWTVDLDKRVKAHESGSGARYTKPRLPVELARAWTVDTRTDARRTEAWVKKLTRQQKVALVDGTVGLPPPSS
jgi:putative endonuclease